MATFEVDVGGVTYEVDAPDEKTAWKWANVEHSRSPKQPEPAKESPKRNVDTSLSVAENLASMLPKGVQDWLSNPTVAGVSLGKGSAVHGAMMGAADPVVGATQLAGNAVGAGDAVNAAVAAKEAEYQQARNEMGRDGFDAARLAGGVGITAPIGGAAAVPAKLSGKIAQGAGMGGLFGLSNPVTEGDFWKEKAKQGAAGTVGGAAMAPLAAGLARVVNPNARERVADLTAEGVRPTLGQTLGGWANRMEEKAQSVPILGDAIMAARNRAREQFNRATINKAVAPIGETVDDIGHAGVAEAGNKLSAAYDAALEKLGGVKFDKGFTSDLTELRKMASNLTPDMARRFNSILNDTFVSRLSPNGSMTAKTLKEVESEIGKKASSFSSQGGAEGELGDALAQLKGLIRDQVARASPEAAQAVRNADKGWANLVRVEGAAKGAKGTDGVFTPGQLLTAVRQADQSVRDRATARGEALMQDWATKGQNVLGNKYPDSGTAGRLMLGAGGVASGVVSPAIPAALLGGAAAYTPAMQSLLTSLITKRPQDAAKYAALLRNMSPALVPAGNAIAQPISQALVGNP